LSPFKNRVSKFKKKKEKKGKRRKEILVIKLIGRVVTLFWSIWYNQNDKIWNDNVRRPSQVGRAAFDH
jgi:cytoskeletal protein RodZ